MKNKRRAVQLAFLVLTLVGVFGLGANCERWCPFGGVEAIYTYASEGNMLCSLGTSNFFILGGVLAMTLLLRRAFCGYLCPLGTIAEWLNVLGRKLHVPQFRIEGTVDRCFALMKYVVLAVILVATWKASELVFRGYDPCYALLSRHGTDITVWAYVVSAAIAVASLFTIVPFCRWFCPFAAVLNPLSRLGFARVKRDPDSCNGCGLCTRRCPAAIPVGELKQVKAARCISCLECVDACPQKSEDGSAALVWGPPDRFGKRWSDFVLLTVMLACVTVAVGASYLFPMPSFVKSRGNAPGQVSSAQMSVSDLTCRGRANLFVYFLERDDLYRIEGYFRVEAWPGPGWADVVITYDPTVTSEDTIKQAITEPYFDMEGDLWRESPFQVEGYDPLQLP